MMIGHYVKVGFKKKTDSLTQPAFCPQAGHSKVEGALTTKAR